MNKISPKLLVFASAALFLAGFGQSLAQAPQSLPEQALYHMAVCPPTPDPANAARCHARVVTDGKGNPHVTATPSGHGPAQFAAAYNPLGVTSTATIAIVDAYDQPNIKADLDFYNQTFGLPYFPTCSATITTSCFQKVDEDGGTNYPAYNNTGWSIETSLDVQVAHALCPDCKILLVEASNNITTHLLKAEDYAASQAKVVSNSWGNVESPGEANNDSHFNKTGVAFIFSSGDWAYTVQYPAASPYVVAVGGTTLNMSSTTVVSEVAWTSEGSGCSAYESQPAFQTALGMPGCSNRIVADVSASADPFKGAAVYDSCYQFSKKTGCSGGWYRVGGTSLSAPLIAAIFALANDIGPNDYATSIPYAKVNYATNTRDIITGKNGNCGGSYLCTAMPGYDGPTGLGSPNGVGAY